MSKASGTPGGRSGSANGGHGQRDGSRERMWRELLAEQRRSGQSVRAFCRSRKLQEASFYYWRREIEQRDREAASRPTSALSTLAPVVVIDEPRREAIASIEIVLCDGTTVRVPPSVTGEQLRLVLAALESPRC